MKIPSQSKGSAQSKVKHAVGGVTHAIPTQNSNAKSGGGKAKKSSSKKMGGGY